MEQKPTENRAQAALEAYYASQNAHSPSAGIVIDPSDPMRTIDSIIDTRDAVKNEARARQNRMLAEDALLQYKQKFSVKKLVPRAKRDTLLQGAELVRGAALLAEPDPYAGTKEIVRSAADAPEAIGSVVAPSASRRGSGMQTNAGGMLNLGERRNALTGEVTKTDTPKPLFPDAGPAEAGHKIRIQLASEWAGKLEKMASEIDYVPSTSFGGQILEGAAGSLPHFVGGIAVGGSATLAGGPIAGAAASAAYFSSTEGLMYLSDTYDDLRDQGFDHDEARSRAIMATGPYVAASAVLEFYGGKAILRGLGAGKHLDRVSKLPRWQQAIGGIGLAGVGEGSTEVMQGIVGDAISSYAQDDWSDFSERFNSDVNAQEFIVGAILGGGARTIGEIPNPENYKSLGAWKKAMGEDGAPVATMGDIPIIGPDGVARSFDSTASDQDKQAASEAIATGKAQDPQSIGQNPLSDQEFVQTNLSQFFKENQTEGKIAEPKTDRQRQIQSQATDRGLNVLYVESNDGKQLGLPAAYVGRGTILLDANASDGQVADSLRWHESVHAVEDRSPEAFVNVYALLAETMPEETEAAVAEYRARWRAQHGTDISQERLAREAPSVAAEMILSTLIGAEESSPGTLSRMLAEKPGVIDQVVSLVQSMLRRVGLHQGATRIERVRQRKNHALAAAAIMDAVYALDGVRAGAYSTISTQNKGATPAGVDDGDTSGVPEVENAGGDSDSTPSSPRQVPVNDGPRRARVRVKDTTEFSEAEFRRTRERLAADFGFDSRAMEADIVLEGRDANSLEGSVDFTFPGDVPSELREALQGEGMRTRMMFSGNNPQGMGEDWMSDLGADEMIRRARVLANETDPERERFLINEVGEDRVPGIGMMQTVRALREKNAAKYTLLHPDGSVFREYKTHNGALKSIRFQREAWHKKLLDRRNQGDTTITKADFEREGTIQEEGKGYGEDVALDNPGLLPVGATFEIAGETFIVYEDEGRMRAVSEDGEHDFLLEGVESMPITRRSLDQNAGRTVEFDEPVAADGMIGDIPFAVAPPRDSREFRKWFGDSKVVDENGEPLVVYHGTNASFTAFDPELLGSNTGAGSAKLGFFFADIPDVASTYSESGRVPSSLEKELSELSSVASRLESMYQSALASEAFDYADSLSDELGRVGDRISEIENEIAYAESLGGSVIPAYLSLQNPLIHDQQRTKNWVSFTHLATRARNEGYDGLIIKNTQDQNGFYGDEYHDVYVAFEPTQIKSVNNTGTFDPANPDIRFAVRSKSKADLLKEHREFMRKGVSAIKEPERAARWDAIQTELRDRVYEHYKVIMPGMIAEADASGFPYLGVLMRVMERNIEAEHASGPLGGISRATRFTEDQLADIGEEVAELNRGGGLGASVPAWVEVKDRGRDGVAISTPVGTIWAMRSQEKGAGDQVSSVMVNPFAINGQLKPGQPVWQALIDQDEQKPIEDDDYGVFGQRTFRANTGSQGGLFADQGDGESKIARENRERQEADEKRIGDEPDQGMLFALAGPKSRVWVPRIHAGEVPIDFDLDGTRIEGVELDSSAMRIHPRTADRLSAALGVINDRKSSREVISDPLGDVIDWPELFEAYPQIQRLPVKIEVTDAVDNFGGGLGIRGFNTELAEPVDLTVYLSPFSDIYKHQAGGDPFARADQHMKQTLIHEIQHAIASYEGWQGGSNTSMIPLAAATKRARDQLGVQFPNQEQTIRARFGMYFENAGERMSRNAERRRSLTPEQRRAMPYDTTIESRGDSFWVGFAVPTKKGDPPNVTITSPAGADIQLRDPGAEVKPEPVIDREGGAQGQQRLSGSDPLTGEQGMLFAAALSTTSPRGFDRELQSLRDQKAGTLRMVKEFTNARRAFISRSWTGADGVPHHMAKLVSRETGPQRETYPWRVTSFMKRGDEAWEPWGHTIHRSRREAMIEAASGVQPEQVQEIRFATRRPDSKQPVLPGTQPAQERFIPYGRPDLANPGETEGVRGMVDAADELRNQIGLPNTRHDAQVEAEADAMMRMNRKIGDQLVERANAGEILNDVETVVLQRHVNRLGLEALRDNSSAGYVQGLRAIDAYRNSGTAAARAFRMRRDDLKSPSERFRESLMGALFEYDPKVRKKFKELRETITDPSTPPKKKKQAIDEQNRLFETEAKKIGRVRGDLAKAGLNPRGLNPISMSDPTTAAAVMDTARRARTGVQDTLYWIWMNNILSGPLTHMANMIGNSINLVWRFGVVKPIEGAAGTVEGAFGGDPDFTLSDWMVMWKSIMPSLMAGYRNMAVSWSSNRQVFDEAITGEPLPVNTFKGEQVFVPDAGPRNKAVRALGLGGVPLKLLMVEDQFFKSFASTLEAYALAHRQAVREGLKGVERANRVQELLSPTQLLYGQYSFASEIWTQALDEGRKAVFQDDPSVLGKAALELRNGSLGPVFKWVIPFVRTPDRIFVRGIHMSGIGAFLGTYNAAVKGYEAASGKRVNDRFVSRRESAAGDIAVAITSLAMLMLLYGLKDDEEGRPRITGSASRDYRDRAEQYRTAPPQSIRLGGKWYSYARLEPFATGMAMTIDMLNEVEGSGDLFSALPAGGRSLVRQTQDKTFLEGVGSLIEAVEQIAKDDPDEERGVDMVAGIVRRTLITGWVPNLFKQVARADNPVITENRPNKDDPFWDRQLAGLEYDLLPLERFADTPRYDVWGRPIERGAPVDGRFVGFLWRVGVPINVSDDDLHPMDLLLDNYNERVKRGDFEGHPMGGEMHAYPPPRTFIRNGERVRMTSEEYQSFVRDAGRAASERLLSMDLNIEEPTPRDAAIIREVMGMFYDRERERMLRSRQESNEVE